MSDEWKPRETIDAMSLREFKALVKRTFPPKELEEFLHEWKISILARVPYGASSEFILLYRDEALRGAAAYRKHLEDTHRARRGSEPTATAKEIAAARAAQQLRLERDAADKKAAAYMEALVNAVKLNRKVLETMAPSEQYTILALLEKEQQAEEASTARPQSDESE